MTTTLTTNPAAKIFAIIFAFSLLVLSGTGSVSAQTTMSIGSLSASVGDTLTIPISVANFNDVGAISLKINYDSAATKYLGITGAPANVSFVGSANATTITLGWFDMSGSTPLNFGTGILVKLRMLYKGGTTSFTINPALCEIASGTGSPLSVTYSNGTLTQSLNAKPTFTSIAAIAKNEKDTVSFIVSAIDPNSGDVLTYSAGTLPAGATFNAATRAFLWVPALNTAGSYSVKFYVTDGSLKDSTTASITIAKTNVKPTLNAIAAIAKNERDTVSFTVSATDPNTGDVLTYSAGTLPAGAAFNAATRTFTWIPALNTAGVYSVKVYVTDGSLKDSATAAITISKTNLIPVFVSRIPVKLDSVQANLGYALNFKVAASDPNNDAITYTWKLNGAVVKTGKDSTYAQAAFAAAGQQKIVCVFTDGALADSTVWTFIVATKVTAVATLSSGIPTEYSLNQNYPNPFNPTTSISFGLPVAAPVTLEIYDILGAKVRTLVSGSMMSAAFHNVAWDGKNDAGSQVGSGMYLYRIASGNYVSAKKMLLMK